MLIKVTKNQIEERKKTRPSEYWSDMEKCDAFIFNSDGSAEIDTGKPCYANLKNKWDNWVASNKKKILVGKTYKSPINSEQKISQMNHLIEEKKKNMPEIPKPKGCGCGKKAATPKPCTNCSEAKKQAP